MVEAMLSIVPPLLLAACAGYVPYRAGVLNIGLEGLMALGAFFGFLGAAASGSWWGGLTAGALSGGAAAALFAWLVLKLQSNIFLSGLALNLAAAGGLGIASQLLFRTKGVLRPRIIDGQGVFPAALPTVPVVLGALAFIALVLVLKKSRWGHRIIAAGEAPETLEILGIPVKRKRFEALVISGIGCGAAGALLALNIGAYVPNMTGGRGWIALVALYIAADRPLGLLGTVILFAAATAAATMLQGLAAVPDSLLLASPFFFTFLGLAAASALRTAAANKGKT